MLLIAILQKRVEHCTENPLYVIAEKEFRGLSPNSYNHVSVSDLYIPMQDLSTYLAAAK